MTRSRLAIITLVGALAAGMAAPGAVFAEARDGSQPPASEKDRNPFRGVGNAFRTAGRGVVYGTRTAGRAISGRRGTPEGRAREAHDRARMEQRARETRRDFRGY